jgi:hypothetical protein
MHGRSEALFTSGLMILIVIGQSACAGADSRVAVSASYRMQPDELFEIAADVVSHRYDIDTIDRSTLTLKTRFEGYDSIGAVVGAGRGKYALAFVVQVVARPPGVAIVVHPLTFEPQPGLWPNALPPNSATLPGFVHERATSLSVEIYNRARQYAIP